MDHLQRLQSNLTNAAAPSRSHTDPHSTSPEKRQERTSNLHTRMHSSTVSGARHQHTFNLPGHGARQRARDTVHSALDPKPPVSFEHLLRRDRKSPDSSRHGSADHQHQADIEAWRAAQEELQAREAARRRVTPGEVARARADAAHRDEELRLRLKRVEDVGMRSTRELDDTYYAILEKAAALRAVVGSLQLLAEESRRMHASFRADTAQLERDTRRDLDAFHGFTGQEEAVGRLVTRLMGAKAQTEALNQRLEDTRQRIMAYEKRENAKEATRRKQWHATWGTLLGVVVLLVALAVVKHYRAFALQLDAVGGVIGEIAVSPVAKSRAAMSSPSEDPFLRKLFDEL